MIGLSGGLAVVLACPAAAAAAALVCAPADAGAHLRQVLGVRAKPAARTVSPGVRLLALPAVGLVVLGIPGAVAGLLAAGVLAGVGRAAARRRRTDLVRATVLELLEQTSARLAAGQPAASSLQDASAAMAADASHQPNLARVQQTSRQQPRRPQAGDLPRALGDLAGQLALGVEPPQALRALAEVVPAARFACRAAAAVWDAGGSTGSPLSPGLDQVCTAVRSDYELRRETAAELAGVRASGVLLACLPVLGIGLGALVGAQPLDVLFGTGVGRVLLGVGVGLDALGLLWLRRLGERVAR